MNCQFTLYGFRRFVLNKLLFSLLSISLIVLISCSDDDSVEDNFFSYTPNSPSSSSGGGGVSTSSSPTDNNTANVYSDPETGLMWQNINPLEKSWDEADSYCESLELGGFSDWRVPTINDLKTLIKGCASTIEECNVSDSCRSKYSCWEGDKCSCPDSGGPAEQGFYWDSGTWEYFGDQQGSFWSSSKRSDSTGGYSWYVRFNNGSIMDSSVSDIFYVRCVRN